MRHPASVVRLVSATALLAKLTNTGSLRDLRATRPRASTGAPVKKFVKLVFCRSGVPLAVSHAEVARTPSARAHGLRGRHGLAPYESMLFVWSNLTNEPFTMAGVSFAIDFVFLDRAARIVDIARRVPPDTPRVTARTSFQYAIELPGGFCDANSISTGEYVSALAT